MPIWEGIEDVSSVASCVWLERSKDSEEWKPLRKRDCLILSEAEANDKDEVYIEYGRVTANLKQKKISYNFVRGDERQLCSATWFIKQEKSKDDVTLEPITNHSDAEKIEKHYQKAVEAATFYGDGIKSVLSEQVLLEDGESKVQVVKSSTSSKGSTLSIKKMAPGWFSGQLDLQRGYGEYTVEGEEDEMCLAPTPKHLWFNVHGIGEALFSREDFSNMPSMVEVTNSMRMSMQKRQVEDWRKQCKEATKRGDKEPPPPNRMEVIQVEWFHDVHDSSTALMKSLKATTLHSIPALRAIANDVVFDVLMYLTPQFCQKVLECVTSQINELYEKFQTIHPNFAGEGVTHLIGHSLGSVIVWDLLSILKEAKRQDEPIGETSTQLSLGVTPTAIRGEGKDDSAEFGCRAYESIYGTWGPSLTERFDQTICFEPDTTIFLGSPLGIFLTLRGAHAVFNNMRKTKTDGELEESAARGVLDNPHLVSPFTLPTRSLYNIFHPSDPVAYRIEPLLLPQDLDDKDVPPPAYLTAPGVNLRFHLKAKQFIEESKKNFEDTKNAWTAAVSAIVPKTNASEANIGLNQSLDGGQARSLTFPLGGTSPRVDFSLQPGAVENEYLSAVSAHSTYFSNTDVQNFVISIASRFDFKQQQRNNLLFPK